MKPEPDNSNAQRDSRLIRQFMEGDYAAMDTLVTIYNPLLLPYLIRMLGNIEDAADVLQDTWLMAFMQISHGGYRDEGCFDKWIRTIAVRRVFVFRIKNNRITKMKTEVKAYFIADIKAHDLTPINLNLLRKAIDTLSPKQKEIAILHLIDNKPSDEIAEILNITLRAVTAALSKAKQKLRKALKAGG